MKTYARYFKAVQLKWDLNRVFRTQKSSGGIGRRAKHQAYITAWDIVYQEVLAISKDYGEIFKSVLANTDTNPLRKELKNRNTSESNDVTKQ